MHTVKRLILIPVYNEALNLVELISHVREFYGEDILIINDGSTDETKELVSQQIFRRVAAIHHPSNRGYGASLIEGFNYAIQNGYNQLLTMDADWQHEPACINTLFAELDRRRVDIISGSRYHKDSTVSGVIAPEDRRHINLEITAELNRRFKLNLTDSFCGFKAYRVAALCKLELTEVGYAFPLQFWVQAVAFGLTVAEVAVPRVYIDATKTFPGALKDAKVRRQRYLDLIDSETKKWLKKDQREFEKQTCVCPA